MTNLRRFALKDEETVLVCLLTLFVCRAMLAGAIVPPWQGPDEPTHFVATQLLAVPRALAPATQRVVEQQVLQSMGEHRWWEPYGGRTPDPVPTKFYDIQRLGKVNEYSQSLYYNFGGALLRLTQPQGVEAAYLHLRVLAIVLSVVTLVLGWAGTRLMFGPVVANGATAIAALHPQFLLTAIAVNSDVLLNVCGAFIWWQAARALSGRRPELSLVLLIVGAGAALLTKRAAVPLVGAATLAVLLGFAAPRARRITRRNALVVGILGGVGVVILLGWLVETRTTALVSVWRSGFIVRRQAETASFSAALEYARISVDYTWLVAGWLRFPAPKAWLWVVRLLTISGLVGVAVLLIRSPAIKRPLSIAWLFVTVHAATIIGLSFWTLASPQGRYLFPVVAPATALLWLGLTHAAPVRFRPYAGPMLISILAVMDVTGFTTVLIPAYLPWG